MKPGDIPPLQTDIEGASELGQLGVPMSSPFAKRWDKRDDVVSCDYDAIGEDSKGIWCTAHPQALYLENPDLWWSVERFAAGDCDMLPGDWDELSAFEFEAKLAMVRAKQREVSNNGSQGRRGSQD